MEFFLDASKNIKISLDLTGIRPMPVIHIREYSQELNPKIKENLEWNLYNLIQIRQHYDDFTKYDLFIGEQKFAQFSTDTEEIKKIYSLTCFEVRRLGQDKYDRPIIGEKNFRRSVIFPRDEKKDFKTKTDVHSHLSAVLYGKDLIDIGKECNMSYPEKIAKLLNLDVEGLTANESGYFRFNDILGNNPKNESKILDSLEICPYTNETFNRMEEIYVARSPFTKNKNILESVMWKIAERYVENGIEYVELSSTEVIRDAEFLSKMHEILPKIEEFWKGKGKTINIRFLAAIARDAIEEKKDDEIDILKSISKSPYIVGCDFLGHESNPTSAIEPQLKEITKWAVLYSPDFEIRVHAGETDIFNNVEAALEIIKEAYEEVKEENAEAVLPPIRIGHAVYKVKTDAVNKLSKELGAVFECNATSNYSLNNIADYNSPLKKNLDRGIPTVIGTDGFGLYGTSPIDETIIAKGRDISDYSLVNRTEDSIIERSLKRFEIKKKAFEDMLNKQMEEKHSGDITRLFKPEYRFGVPQYMGTTRQKLDMENEENIVAIFEFLRESYRMAGTEVITGSNFGKFEEKVGDRKPILIIDDALKTDNQKLPFEGNDVKKVIDYLVKNVDPDKAFFAIGGVKCGAERYLIKCLKANSKKKKFILLNFVTAQAIMRKEVRIIPDVITDAVLVEHKSPNILSANFLLPKEMGDFLKGHNGMMVALGGGTVVADVVQYAYNVGNVDIYLDTKINGIARKKDRQLGESAFGFSELGDFIKIFEKNEKDILDESRSKWQDR